MDVFARLVFPLTQLLLRCRRTSPMRLDVVVALSRSLHIFHNVLKAVAISSRKRATPDFEFSILFPRVLLAFPAFTFNARSCPEVMRLCQRMYRTGECIPKSCIARQNMFLPRVLPRRIGSKMPWIYSRNTAKIHVRNQDDLKRVPHSKPPKNSGSPRQGREV
ncbi:hypothetical protein MVEN_00007400 [Mycena venus]|uniref:Uncharacterized protein n=1 Tax=Mycena venus TaxID=2733690 RepID=A0A8H6Z827_9AGAR|nr:hypothetical protein MVEN_00007400 [Mycena venus]